ncbi:SidA/IucD/PvdA family monooxygenase [Dactylosporangium sp. AC04546]|uniref:lysine N(6)-hydroxylase/L-ornithine N(5)-oxygenase family protein n=1 Tax=Dactylosporangium sp. AC04546 TaxID=2862460 RepID=UPI001EDDA588|nr:SidA/IucD/PvdA family monooxygenase [Dactylosporangium sp. AC04546]WVK88942.1 SidA/IucD/PvdA family monooxygenase [Dactylosporangium sp. AC04546]
MPQSRQDDTVPVYDLVGVGFGPSNLALAIAVHEHNATAARPVSAVFLERQAAFGWHRGMLIQDATMQVSFLKDLVTLRNPASSFSFLCYLHECGRLSDFVNHKSLFPLRIEFHDYLEWAAVRVDEMVNYGHEVVAVHPVVNEPGDDSGDGTDAAIEAFDVAVRDATGARSLIRTRNVVLAGGLRPALPPGIEASGRIWHSRDLLTNVDSLAGTAPARFVVVGAGQSAAEATAFLHERFPAAEVCAVLSRYGYSPADDSPFANRIFDATAVDQFFGAPAPVKSMLLGYHANTNYSVVDTDLIEDLYRRVYRETVLGAHRLRLLNVSRLAAAEELTGPDRVAVTVRSMLTDEETVLDADVLVCATGYAPADPFPVLGDLTARCHRDEQGRALVERDYRIRTDAAVHAGIYLQGGTEHTHGISASLLSNTATRAAEILASVCHRRSSGHAPARRAQATSAV